MFMFHICACCPGGWPKRGHWSHCNELQMVVSYNVDTVNQIRTLPRSIKCSKLMRHWQSPIRFLSIG